MWKRERKIGKIEKCKVIKRNIHNFYYRMTNGIIEILSQDFDFNSKKAFNPITKGQMPFYLHSVKLLRKFNLKIFLIF